ncbi:MAG: hypothetical protein AB8B62_08125 [Roseobacter sp.]
MIHFLISFFKHDDGAITVDWVVLTAALAGLSIGFVVQLKQEGDTLSDSTRAFLEEQDPAAAAGRNIQD